MVTTAPFSSPLFEIVAAAFGRALGELVSLQGVDGDLEAALEHARQTALETMESLAQAQEGDGDVSVLR